jgi:hypothetical protein
MHRSALTLPLLLILLLLLGFAPACGETRGEEEPAGGQTCRECHRKLSPELIADLEASPHERVPVTCEECHGSDHDRIFAVKGEVPPTVCAKCHPKEWEEFSRSHHGRHLRGGKMTPALMQHSFSVGSCGTESGCHSIQKKYADGSVGRCSTCHPTHTFSNHEARNPRVCYTCHCGEDNPEYEVWIRSAHSFRSPSRDGYIADCVECHDTHDVSRGITRGLSPVATETPPLFVPTLPVEEWQEARGAMMERCRKCHGTRFAREALKLADDWRRRAAILVEEAGKVVRRLEKAGLLRPSPAERVPNPFRGNKLVLGGVAIFDMDLSIPERLYYDMRFHVYPRLWRGCYHNDPERHVWELVDQLKTLLDRVREYERQALRDAKAGDR